MTHAIDLTKATWTPWAMNFQQKGMDDQDFFRIYFYDFNRGVFQRGVLKDMLKEVE